MTVNLIKLCVGVESLDDLKMRHRARLDAKRAAGEPREIIHTTRIGPKRRDELLNAGSLYWVIKGFIGARQQIKDLRERRGADGITRCDIVLKPKIIAVMPTPRRAFQGWRYLETESAPEDIDLKSKEFLDLTPAMRADLLELGLI